ncbi:MAG: neutral/alkaline non-lysosomal ceramidase N-terminal domain-containing protein [Oscillospiraceae bacterium]|nr:neutral/alkaline non-lysosomal ceramidase N-terminal domain-containing protein [Oscillospiraceae bacterium]
MSLKVGFGRTCITPEESVPLAGYGNTSMRMSKNVLDDLYATAVTFSDDKETVILITLDMLHAKADWTESIRSAITEACGVPGNHIMVAHTHTHAAPDAYNNEEASLFRYKDFLVKKVCDAAILSMNDRLPAKLFAGVRKMQQNTNFVRNYIKDKTAPDGIRHAGEPDRRMQLVKITREGGKDILLMNWQAHPTLTGGLKKTDISADYIGVIRDIMEEKTDSLFAFFQGASGNLTCASKIVGETITRNHKIYGGILAEWSMYLYNDLKPVEGEKVSLIEKTLRIPIDHSDDHMVEAAKIVDEHWRKYNDYAFCNKFANSYSINSVYHAAGILRRARMGESLEMVLNVFSVGGISFVCAPFEMYAINSSYVKENSPFDMTFIVTSCNTLHNYLAEDLAFDYGCYEVDFRRYPRGTAERVADAFCQMLQELKGT